MDQTAVRLRHELKYSIDRGACALLRERLGAVMRPDAHAGAGGYEVRSLYFDDMYGSAYGDKSAGLLRREKFRLRIYDGDDGCIKLERKAKVGALCHKESERLSRASYDALLAGELPAPDTPGLRGALRTAARTRLLRPTVIVEYRREAFVCDAGNVRVTFDRDLCACVGDTDLFSDRLRRLPCYRPGFLLMEVKFDGFLPAYIRRALQTDRQRCVAFSKYAVCRDVQRGRGPSAAPGGYGDDD